MKQQKQVQVKPRSAHQIYRLDYNQEPAVLANQGQEQGFILHDVSGNKAEQKFANLEQVMDFVFSELLAA